MPPESSSGGAYLKLERKAGDFATVAVAAQLTLEERSDGSYFSSAGIGLTALGAKSLRAKEAEARLIGKKVREETIAGASSAAAEECSPTDDQLRGSSKYKREMARLYTRRAIDLAVARARGRRARSSK
jgi:carbon-monoxide dehydrogenase medium subunit